MKRHLPLSGAENFRDLGGYQTPDGAVAWRRVFRADRLTELTETDANTLALLSLKIHRREGITGVLTVGAPVGVIELSPTKLWVEARHHLLV